jgi:hypothetical protein
MPVVLDLSTWAFDRDPLGNWIVDELSQSYQVPRTVARSWEEAEAVLPLLDGLDEVDEQARDACVAVINAYSAAHQQMPLVVCSRTETYRALAVPAAGGEALVGARQSAEANADLLEHLRTPLFLSLVALAYEDLPPEAVTPVSDPATWQQELFSDYVWRMLTTDQRLKQYVVPRWPVAHTKSHLAWLAREMRARGLAEFRLERLRPDWLPDPYAGLRHRALVGPVVELGIVVVEWLFALVGGAAGGLFAMTDLLVKPWPVHDPDTVSSWIRGGLRVMEPSWRTLGGRLVAGVAGGLTLCLVAAMLGIWLGAWALLGLAAVLLVGLSLGADIALARAVLRWTLRRESRVPPHLVRFLNYAADHMLLQRVDGGYRFIHTLMRDCFADLDVGTPSSVEAHSTPHLV